MSARRLKERAEVTSGGKSGAESGKAEYADRPLAQVNPSASAVSCSSQYAEERRQYAEVRRHYAEVRRHYAEERRFRPHEVPPPYDRNCSSISALTSFARRVQVSGTHETWV